MKWRSGRRSDNVEDRRSSRPATAAKMGGIGVIIMLVMAFLSKGNINLNDILSIFQGQGGQQAVGPQGK